MHIVRQQSWRRLHIRHPAESTGHTKCHHVAAEINVHADHVAQTAKYQSLLEKKEDATKALLLAKEDSTQSLLSKKEDNTQANKQSTDRKYAAT